MGRTLAHLWHKQATFVVQDVLTQSQASAQAAVDFIGAGRAVAHMGDMRKADVWLLAVPDGQIAATANLLAKTAIAGVFVGSDAIVFHASGALSAAELATLQMQGWHAASAHCILSFSAPASAVAQFAGTLCALEGDARATAVLQTAFESIGANCFDLAAKDKLLYHAAAVFATNFVPVLQSVAEALWHKTGVPADKIAPLAATLLQNTVQNIRSQGAAKALTGPAARGDTALVQVQGEAVAAWNETAGQAYKSLSQLATALAQQAQREA